MEQKCYLPFCTNPNNDESLDSFQLEGEFNAFSATNDSKINLVGSILTLECTDFLKRFRMPLTNLLQQSVNFSCQFDAQSKSYQQKIINETKIKVSIEAASTDCWKKYVGNDGLTFGIDKFGKSAPYKEIYKNFGLTADNISKKTKNLVKSKL